MVWRRVLFSALSKRASMLPVWTSATLPCSLSAAGTASYSALRRRLAPFALAAPCPRLFVEDGLDGRVSPVGAEALEVEFDAGSCHVHAFLVLACTPTGQYPVGVRLVRTGCGSPCTQ